MLNYAVVKVILGLKLDVELATSSTVFISTASRCFHGHNCSHLQGQGCDWRIITLDPVTPPRFILTPLILPRNVIMATHPYSHESIGTQYSFISETQWAKPHAEGLP